MYSHELRVNFEYIANHMNSYYYICRCFVRFVEARGVLLPHKRVYHISIAINHGCF